VGADEQDGTFGNGEADAEVGEGLEAEPYVAASPVAGRFVAFDEAGPFQHTEVVSEQVGGEAVTLAQFGGGAVGEGEVVDDGEAGGVAEGGVLRGAAGDVCGVHAVTINLNNHCVNDD
jgi:hypothetical protein